MRYNGDAARRARSCSTTSPAPSSRRPSTSTSARRRSRPWAAIRTKSSPCWSGPSTPTPTTPAPCSAWPCENDRHGNDDYARAALRAGRQAVSRRTSARCSTSACCTRTCEHFERAKQCYQRILDVVSRRTSGPGCTSRTPTPRATCTTTRKPAAARIGSAQMLSVPVTDFELSVRSRNCLQKMGIRTLGDLTADDRAGAAGQQELRRDVARRNPRDAVVEGPGARPVRLDQVRRTSRRSSPTS